MQKARYWILAIMLLMPFIPAFSETVSSSAPVPSASVYGTYDFVKQLYINPLSSFFAPDGFQEQYELGESSFAIIDSTGVKKSLEMSIVQTDMDEKEYQSSFMPESIDAPDITDYKNRIQYTLTNLSDGIEYRLLQLDDETWLIKMHTDTVNVLKTKYIWSIYRIVKVNEQ